MQKKLRKRVMQNRSTTFFFSKRIFQRIFNITNKLVYTLSFALKVCNGKIISKLKTKIFRDTRVNIYHRQ